MKTLNDSEIAEMEKRLSPQAADTLSFADEFKLTIALAYNKALKRHPSLEVKPEDEQDGQEAH